MRSFALSRARNAEYPGIFQDIEQHIGTTNAHILSAQFGGTRLYIPSNITSEHQLCRLLGQDITHLLSREFGGLTVEIPRGIQTQIAQRNCLIAEDRATGMSQRQLALKYGLTERTIRKIKI